MKMLRYLHIFFFLISLIGLFYFQFNFTDLIIILIMYFLFGGYCNSIILHRSLSHGNRLPAWAENFGIWLSTLSFIGPPLGYVALHRQHHHKTESPEDPHSPSYKNILQIFYGSYDFKLNPLTVRDCLKNKCLSWISQHYLKISFIQFATLSLFFDFKDIYLFIILPASISYHTANAVNYFCHTIGNRRFQLNNKSTNFWPLGIIVFGEGWHNNHHANPANPYFGYSKWEIDVGGYIHRIIKNLGEHYGKIRRSADITN